MIIKTIVLQDGNNKKITYNNNDEVVSINFYNSNSLAHNENGAAYIGFEDGKISVEKFCINGAYYREGGLPQYIEYYKNGFIKCNSYYENNTYSHPTKIEEFYNNGNIKSIKHTDYQSRYYDNSLSPFLIEYYKNGKIKLEKYGNLNSFNRLNGPAVIVYSTNGNIQSKYFYINGLNRTKTYNKYFNYSTDQLIKTAKNSKDKANLSLMKLAAIDKNDTQALDVIDSKITMIKIAD